MGKKNPAELKNTALITGASRGSDMRSLKNWLKDKQVSVTVASKGLVRKGTGVMVTAPIVNVARWVKGLFVRRIKE